MTKLVRVFDGDGNYIGAAFIEGIKFIKGEYGWFPSLELLTLSGEKLDGWRCCVYPFTLMLDCMEYKNEKESE